MTLPYTKTVIAGASLGFFGAAGYDFFAIHNTQNRENTQDVFKKMDGLFGYTQVTRYDAGRLDVIHFSRKGVQWYIDENKDGYIDILVEPLNIVLYRKNDFDEYWQTFESADRDFQEQIQRFAPLLNKANKTQENKEKIE